MKSWPGYGFLDEKELGRIRGKMPLICKTLNERDSEGQKSFLWTAKAWTLRVGLCEGGKVQDEHLVRASEPYRKHSERTNATFARFCETSVKQGKLSSAYSVYLSSVDSNLDELFCTMAENIGKPGVEGFRQLVGMVLGTVNAPTLVELRGTAKELCISLKLDEIQFREAWVRLEAEERFARPTIVKEATEIVQETVWGWLTWPFVALAALLGVIGTTVGIYKAVHS